MPIDMGKDEQFAPDFLKISPNNKIPAIVDGEFTLFESGAILPEACRWYVSLAERPAFQPGYTVPRDTGPVPLP